MNKVKVYEKEFFKHVYVGKSYSGKSYSTFNEWESKLSASEKKMTSQFYEMLFDSSDSMRENEIVIEENPFNLK